MSDKCQAKNPSTCRYHGSLAYHTEQYDKATTKYINDLHTYLATSQPNTNDFQEQQNSFLQAQGAYDAHDENYLKLVERLEDLKESHSPDLEFFNYQKYANNVKDLKEVEERIILADIYRSKRNTSEVNTDTEVSEAEWRNDYVAYIPAGSRIASGETVVAVRRRLGLPSNKREVILKNSKGETKASIWGSHTKVNFVPPVVTVGSQENEEDPWGPKN